MASCVPAGDAVITSEEWQAKGNDNDKQWQRHIPPGPTSFRWSRHTPREFLLVASQGEVPMTPMCSWDEP